MGAVDRSLRERLTEGGIFPAALQAHRKLIYIEQKGSDTLGDGSLARPFASLTKAIQFTGLNGAPSVSSPYDAAYVFVGLGGGDFQTPYTESDGFNDADQIWQETLTIRTRAFIQIVFPQGGIFKGQITFDFRSADIGASVWTPWVQILGNGSFSRAVTVLDSPSEYFVGPASDADNVIKISDDGIGFFTFDLARLQLNANIKKIAGVATMSGVWDDVLVQQKNTDPAIYLPDWPAAFSGCTVFGDATIRDLFYTFACIMALTTTVTGNTTSQGIFSTIFFGWTLSVPPASTKKIPIDASSYANLRADGSVLPATQWEVSGVSHSKAGVTTIGAGTTFLHPAGYITTSSATEAEAVDTRATTRRILKVKHKTALAQTVTYKVRKNGADAVLTVTVTSGSTATFTDATNVVQFAADDRFSLSVTASGAGGVVDAVLSWEEF